MLGNRPPSPHGRNKARKRMLGKFITIIGQYAIWMYLHDKFCVLLFRRTRSRCPAHVGIGGTLVVETRRMVVLDEAGTRRCVPKSGAGFRVSVPARGGGGGGEGHAARGHAAREVFELDGEDMIASRLPRGGSGGAGHSSASRAQWGRRGRAGHDSD